MSETPNTTKPGSEMLGPDGQPVPAMGPHDKDMHGGAGSAGGQQTRASETSRPPAKPGDTPADTTMTADSDTGPMISERPMPAQSDRARS